MTEPVNVPDLTIYDDVEIPFVRLNETPTDLGNSYRFARIFSGRVRYLAAEDTWLIWDGTRLKRDDTGHVFDMTRDVCEDVIRFARETPEDQRPAWFKWANATQSTACRSSMLKAAATLPEIAVSVADLDSQPNLLNTPSGTVDLDTGTIYPPRIEDLLTKTTNISVDLTVTESPLLKEYIDTFMPDPAEWKYFLKILGSALRGGNPYRIWPIIHGPSTTGKTQIVQAMAKVLGDYMVAVPTSVFRANQDDKPRPDLVRSLPARIIYADEGSEAWDLHGDHIKKMTGGDPVVCRGMNSNKMIERIPSFTPMIICNDLPHVHGADAALRRRLRIIEFGNSVIANEDIRARERFMTCEQTLTALFTQLIFGCWWTHQESLDDIPKGMAEATMSAFDSLNHVSAFIADLRSGGVLSDGDPVSTPAHTCWTANDLYGSYLMWLTVAGDHNDQRSRLSRRDLGKVLRTSGWESSRSGTIRWLGRVKDPNATL